MELQPDIVFPGSEYGSV